MHQQHPYRDTIPPISDREPRPLWSVMIPTYNCATYLRETLACVLAQDPGPDKMQIEVVDDCSTKDDPAAVVEERGQGRVSFYRQPANVGYIGNFATCLQRSRGQLVHLLHGDDCVRPGFYQKLQQAFEQTPETGAAFSRHIYIDEHSHWQTISELEQPQSGIIANWLEKIASGQRLTTPSIVVRRDVYEALGGFDRRMTCAGEDWEMWVRIAANYAVWYEPEPLALYRVKREGSLTASSSRTNKLVQDMRKATEIIESYLPSYLPQSTVKKVSKKARGLYASWALEPIPQMVASGDLLGAISQVKTALGCRNSPRVMSSAILFALKGGKDWISQHSAQN